MTEYLVKMFFCSALFYAGYRLLLEKLSTRGFNRIYLLASLVVPFLLPLFEFTISAKTTIVPVFSDFPGASTSNITSVQLPDVIERYSIRSTDIFIWGYLLVSGLMLMRMVMNLLKLRRAVTNAIQIQYLGIDVNLLEEPVSPFSFMDKIYISKKDFRSGRINSEILEHEQTHVKQRHSLDIILFEFIQAISWINPLLPFIGRSIRLNHEFLADSEVAGKTNDIRPYQYMLIGLYTKPGHSDLASSLHYSLTKKRLTMMTNTTPRSQVLLHQTALLPVIFLAIMISCLKIQAQITPPLISNNKSDTSKAAVTRILPRTPSTINGVSNEELSTFTAELDKYKMPNGRYRFDKMLKADRDKLEKIFYSMNRKQQSEQTVHFVPESNVPMAKQIPTQKQFDNWKDSKIYGVWLNSKRIKNSELEKYKRDEIALFNISKLAPNAVNYGKHYYQVTLMTEHEYEVYAARNRAATGSYILYSYGRKP